MTGYIGRIGRGCGMFWWWLYWLTVCTGTTTEQVKTALRTGAVMSQKLPEKL